MNKCTETLKYSLIRSNYLENKNSKCNEIKIKQMSHTFILK